jgi:gas vesicle protein
MIKMHKSEQNSNFSTIAVAALIGGLAGAVVGLMLAPKSGKDLRQDITLNHAGALKQQGTDLVGKGKQLAEDLQTFIQESLKVKKSGFIPITFKDTPSVESLQSEPEMDT